MKLKIQHSIILLLGIVLVGCQANISGKFDPRAHQEETDPALDGEDLSELDAGLHQMAVKSNTEILQTFTALTGVSVGRVISEYQTIEASLPDSNSVQSFSASHRLAILNFAYHVGRAVAGFTGDINNGTNAQSEAYRQAFFEGTVYGEENLVTLGVAKEPENKQILLDRILDRTYGQRLTQSRQVAYEELDALFESLLQSGLDGNPENQRALRRMISILMAAALSSAAVTMF